MNPLNHGAWQLLSEGHLNVNPADCRYCDFCQILERPFPALAHAVLRDDIRGVWLCLPHFCEL